MSDVPLILASRSPRRAALLRKAGYSFEQVDPPFEDPPPPDHAQDNEVGKLTVNLARRKAASALSILDLLPSDPAIIIGADTICVHPDGRLVGKPANRDEARQMLADFADRSHAVVTGVALLNTRDGEMTDFFDAARVTFGSLTDEQITTYLDSGQWHGKAGAYNLFDRQADGWPIRVEPESDPTTIVGLPMEMLAEKLDGLLGTDTDTQLSSSRLSSIMSGDNQSRVAGLARFGLQMLTPFYASAIAMRNRSFDWRLRKAVKLPRATISVGNLTTGGTGKTPMTIELVRRLLAHGAHPAVLLRGYGARAGRSDEAQVLETELDSRVPVVADPDRVTGARTALEINSDVDVFVLDDGFQRRQVHRDLDLVLIDATRPFGFDHLLPRGLLREPVHSLLRPDGVIVTRADQVSPVQLMKLYRMIESVTGHRPVARAACQWAGYRNASGRKMQLATLKGFSVAAVCGIGNPNSFAHTLKAQAFSDICMWFVGRDHQRYNRKAVDHISRKALSAGAQAVVITEKDWVKWKAALQDTPPALPVYRPVVRMVFIDGQDRVDQMLKRVCP